MLRFETSNSHGNGARKIRKTRSAIMEEDPRSALAQTGGVDASHVDADVRDGVVDLEEHIFHSSQTAYAHEVTHPIPAERWCRLPTE